MTDQPPMGGGEGEAPTPFATFLASLGTCAVFLFSDFAANAAWIPQVSNLIQRVRSNSMTGMVGEIEIEIQVPDSFPEKYYSALVRSAEQCAVKKHMENPPKFNVHTELAAQAV